jgi:hypothetical protein
MTEQEEDEELLTGWNWFSKLRTVLLVLPNHLFLSPVFVS